MAKDKTPGIVLFPEDIQRIKRSVRPEYQFAVILALANFATTGELPTIDDLGEGGMVAFEFIYDKVADALQKYQETSEKRKAAVNARWNTNESDPIQQDTNEYKRIQPDTNVSKTKTETETEIEIESINVNQKEDVGGDAPAPTGKLLAFDGSDLTQDVQRSRDAEMLVAQYLPPSRTPIEYDPRVAEMAALIDKHGAEKVKSAIKTAVSSDNRGGISIAFLAAILDEKGAKKSRAAPVDYQARQYSASEVKGMEVDIDALFDEVERGK